MFAIQICRSHERNTTPQPWETVSSHETPAAAFRDASERLGVAMPAGDAIRILAPDGNQYGVTEFPHAYGVEP